MAPEIAELVARVVQSGGAELNFGQLQRIAVATGFDIMPKEYTSFQDRKLQALVSCCLTASVLAQLAFGWFSCTFTFVLDSVSKVCRNLLSDACACVVTILFSKAALQAILRGENQQSQDAARPMADGSNESIAAAQQEAQAEARAAVERARSGADLPFGDLQKIATLLPEYRDIMPPTGFYVGFKDRRNQAMGNLRAMLQRGS